MREWLGFLPAATGGLQPNAVVFVKVVADPDIGPAVAIQIPEADCERLGFVGQPRPPPSALFLQIDVDASSIGNSCLTSMTPTTWSISPSYTGRREWPDDVAACTPGWFSFTEFPTMAPG